MLTLLCSLLEWPLDKLKFVRLSCPHIRGRFHNSAALLSVLMFLCAVAGLLHYPTGPIWYPAPLLSNPSTWLVEVDVLR